ncbi:MAG: hypothetical protein ACQERB_15240 [Promethearchaeati archaeon]
MGKKSSKILHAELKSNLSTRFEIIKSFLGIQNDAEVVRYLIQYYYKENLESKNSSERAELENDREIIRKFMEKYGEEWKRLGED